MPARLPVLGSMIFGFEGGVLVCRLRVGPVILPTEAKVQGEILPDPVVVLDVERGVARILTEPGVVGADRGRCGEPEFKVSNGVHDVGLAIDGSVFAVERIAACEVTGA